MYVRSDASKTLIEYNSRQETEISGTSDFRLRTSLPTGQAGDLFEVEYWVTGKEAVNHLKYS
jgi:hypothetical protein